MSDDKAFFSLYLAENPWGKQLYSAGLSQEIKIITMDHQLPIHWSTSAFDALASINRSWPVVPTCSCSHRMMPGSQSSKVTHEQYCLKQYKGTHIHLLSQYQKGKISPISPVGRKPDTCSTSLQMLPGGSSYTDFTHYAKLYPDMSLELTPGRLTPCS